MIMLTKRLSCVKVKIECVGGWVRGLLTAVVLTNRLSCVKLCKILWGGGGGVVDCDLADMEAVLCTVV